MSDDHGERAAARILSGESWAEFCDTLKKAGDVILGEKTPREPFDRAEGFRYLARLTRAGLESFLEYGDPLAPEFRCTAHETIKMGADNPDNRYLSATVSGKHEYRITGTRGTVHYLGFGTQAGGYGATGSLETTGYLEAKDMQIGPEGRFEIAVSCEPREGNWLPMRPDSRMVIVRQSFLDREAEVPAEVQIRRVDGPHRPQPLTPERVDRGLVQAARFVIGCASLFESWAESYLPHTNELPEADERITTAAGGDPNIVYYHSYWRLEPDEALVIEVTPPRCDYWNFQLNNHWMESLDYRYHRIHVNNHTAVYKSDGSVQVVVAHEDPGIPDANWIETCGHRQGTMCWRWVRTEEKRTPRTRVVKLSALRRG